MTFFKINTDQLTPSCINYIPVATNKSWLDFFPPTCGCEKENERNEIHAPSFYNTFLSIFLIKITINVYFIYFDS